MDRIVEVVAGPLPRDVERAWAQLLELRREESLRPLDRLPGKELAELYRRLVARYPPFEDDPATPWGDTPMVLDFGDRLAVVPIVEARVADALPFVIATAVGMGFTVFDVTGARIHRPEGDAVLPASLTANAPRHERFAGARPSSPGRAALQEDPEPARRATMLMAGGCALALAALVALWTAGMLFSGLATSLAWGEEPGPQTVWMRHDVPLLMKIAIGSLLPAVALLTIGVRRMMRITAQRTPR